ncbi:MAG: type I restriction endonuclease subunit R, partial [Actinobacteria bacterium]|nr:type I restriction endonuclease subunit R [Actinomycetota bacterium]
AEKFQTGFDQPLLHTMYVDKVLTGLNAVQTLSRLNRILPPLKEDTFVLDFRNDAEDIVRAFEPYYGETVAPPTDPNLLYDTHRRLSDFDVIRQGEVEATVAVLLSMSTKEDHGRVYSLLDPAVERFHGLSEDERLAFKDALDKFVRTYAFLSQVVSFGDAKLERDYLYCRALASVLRGVSSVERLDLGSAVELTHLRHEATFSGALELSADQGEVRTVFGDAEGSQHLPDMEPLSQIVDTLNERFGLELTETDQLLFDQYERDWLADQEVTNQARNNTLENFKLVFDRNFLKTVISRMDENDALFRRILDDPEFQDVIKDFYGAKVYREARQGENK